MNDESTRSPSSVSRRTALAGLGAGGASLALTTVRLAAAQEASPVSCAATEANTRLVERLVAAIRAGDPSEIDEILSPDYVQHQPGVPPGREGFKQFIASIGATPLQVQHTIAEGDLVMVHSVIPAADPTAAPTGEFIDVFRVAGGQVAEHWGAVNMAAAAPATPTT